MFPKRFIALILFAALAVMPTCGLRAQWVQTNGPYGGDVGSIAVIGKNIFAGVNGCGIFLSTDEGISWAPVDSELWSDTYSLVVSGTKLFVGIYSGIFFRPIAGKAGQDRVMACRLMQMFILLSATAGIFLQRLLTKGFFDQLITVQHGVPSRLGCLLLSG
jgi:hypothetical protein